MVASTQQQTPAAPSLVVNHEITVADRWFAGLDQRPFTVGNLPWTTRVLGVHVKGFNTWVQIEFAEDGSSLLLLLTPTQGIDDAIDMIREAMLDRGM